MAPIDPTSDPENVAPSNNPPATPAQQPPTVANATPGTPTQQQQSQPSPAPQSAAPIAPDAEQPTASNTPAAVHPSVQRATRIHEVAQALAGGPRYRTVIDPSSGAIQQVPVPMSKGDVLMAIAMEALSGSLAGLAQRGPGAEGRAGEAGFQQVSAQQTAADQEQKAEAQQQFQDQGAALARHASIMETNSRTILNTQQAERMGVESLRDAVNANADLLQSYKDAGAIDDENITQDELMAGLKSGKYSGLTMTAIPDGWTAVPGKGYEQTFSVVTKPETKVLLTQDQIAKYQAGHVRGFPAGMKVPAGGYPVNGYILGRANQQLLANRFMLSEASDVSNTLAKSSDPATKKLAESIPDFGRLMDDPKQGLAFQNALPKLQKYMHHDGSGDDFYQALVQMSQPTRPSQSNPKQVIDNSSDANAAQVIAGAFGNGDPAQGWKVLRAYHVEITPAPIKSESDAESIISDPASTPREKAHAQTYLKLANQQKATQAAVEARAKASADLANTTDVPTLGEALAKGAITEDQIPGFSKLKPEIQAYLAEHHPNLDQSSLQLTSEERKRKDLATNAISNLGIIQATLQRRPDLFGIISGRLSQGKELVGTDDPDLTAINEALDNYALATTGAHGTRAVQARFDAKQALLNGFKNGSTGVNSAIDTAKQSLQEFANLGKPRGINGSPYVYGSPGSQPSAQKFQFTTKDGKLGWNGSQWVPTGQR